MPRRKVATGPPSDDDLDDLVEHFLATKAIKERTREAYQQDLKGFFEFCRVEGVRPAAAGPSDYVRFQRREEQRGLKLSTLGRRMHSISQFYRWLRTQGFSVLDPTEGIARRYPEYDEGPTLSVDEMRSVVRQAGTPRERAVITLLCVNGLTPDEITKALVEDLAILDDYPVLRVPSRTHKYALPYTVLPHLTDSAIREHIGARTRGPLIQNTLGDPIDRHSVRSLVLRVGSKAEVPFKVTPRVIYRSIRAIAIQRGFSYISVMRAVREVDTTRLPRFIAQAPNPLSDHAAIRLARLMSDHRDTSQGLLEEAEVVLRESDAPPSVAAAMAGAVLERHLRFLCRENNAVPAKGEDDASIARYASALRQRRLLTEAEIQQMVSFQKRRDVAAHGWFEKVSKDDALRFIVDCRRFVKRHPTST